ncbi:MAG: HIT domain-containing protein [Candidatus Kuenenia sp.]|nr:HIT domain-containing protein [Candidatus Kuenenia hertensis]
MKNIWAPWRVTYIKNAPEKDACFLCEAFGGNSEEEKYIVCRGEECFCILNKYPYNSGHLMIVPNRHVADIAELTDGELLKIMKMTGEMKKHLTSLMNPDGFNIGINLGKSAGAGLLGHIHLHIVPRWDGDTNFMPVLSDVKVIPQSLEELSMELKRHISGV